MQHFMEHIRENTEDTSQQQIDGADLLPATTMIMEVFVWNAIGYGITYYLEQPVAGV